MHNIFADVCVIAACKLFIWFNLERFFLFFLVQCPKLLPKVLFFHARPSTLWSDALIHEKCTETQTFPILCCERHMCLFSHAALLLCFKATYSTGVDVCCEHTCSELCEDKMVLLVETMHVHVLSMCFETYAHER
jgi:hypothetical protein